MANSKRRALVNAKLIVIKIGTSSLVGKDGKLNTKRFDLIAQEISALMASGKKAVLVTSGSVAAGAERLGAKSPLKTITEKQAAAAIGQGLLMKAYEESFSKLGLMPAQVLLTRDAFDDRSRYISSRNTIEQILELGAVPVINENDTVSAEEIKVGDNDTLSAMVANLTGADLLVILSDVEGFIMNGEVVDTIGTITSEIIECATGSGTKFGTGGMMTKLSAAKICTSAGIPMVIAGSGVSEVVEKILNGENVGTLFLPDSSKKDGRKRWLLSAKKPVGKVTVDDGAEKALVNDGKSLLAVGVKEVKGAFEHGDVISIVAKNKEIARGVTNFSSSELEKAKGLKSAEIGKVLGYIPSGEVIHRDDMVLS